MECVCVCVRHTGCVVSDVCMYVWCGTLHVYVTCVCVKFLFTLQGILFSPRNFHSCHLPACLRGGLLQTGKQRGTAGQLHPSVSPMQL